jgi:uncharacterized membrane protein
VGPADKYCARCGAGQPMAGAPGAQPRAASDPLGGISPRTASILCYVPWMGWIAAVVVLSADKFRQNRAVRFNAFQGLYLFVASLLDKWVLGAIPWRHFQIDTLVSLVLLGASIFMMVKAAHEEAYSLPLFGELAARSMDQD